MALTRNDDEVLLLHNPRCSKSRALKAALEERGVAFRERLYLEDPLSAAELADLKKRLGGETRALVRLQEPEAAEAGLKVGADDRALLAAIARYPKLLERPVLVHGKRAAIGRPGPEDALEVL